MLSKVLDLLDIFVEMWPNTMLGLKTSLGKVNFEEIDEFVYLGTQIVIRTNKKKKNVTEKNHKYSLTLDQAKEFSRKSKFRLYGVICKIKSPHQF